MYISQITLKNVRCFEHLPIRIAKLGNSVVIAGDNGDGKTSLLRSIALGLCDHASSAALLRELPGDFVRRGQAEPATITIDLTMPGGRVFRTRTLVRRLKHFEQLKQEQFVDRKPLSEARFPWEKIFVCGYGAGRSTSGALDIENYSAMDALYCLFRYDEPLQNSELAIRRLMDEAYYRHGGLKAAKRVSKRIRSLLKSVLHRSGKITIERSGIMIAGKWGKYNVRSCSDGYGAMTTVVLDMVNWLLLYNSCIDPSQMKGIVLIDEIEQHLHPIWQQNVMRLLRAAFPKTQFIVTTHSPLVLSGCKGLQIVRLGDAQPENLGDLYGWKAEDVYRRMGLESSRPKEMQDLIEEYKRLYLELLRKRARPSQRKRLKKIQATVSHIPGMGFEATKAKLNSISELTKRPRR